MSRIGDRKLVIPAGVTVTVEDNVVTVKGPKGELTTKVVNNLEVKVEADTLEVLKKDRDHRRGGARHRDGLGHPCRTWHDNHVDRHTCNEISPREIVKTKARNGFC